MILNGAALKDQIFAGVLAGIASCAPGSRHQPCVAFVGVTGHEPLMKYTVAMHEQAARGLGFRVVVALRPDTVTEDELCAVVEQLSDDASIHAVVLLQPMPPHINAIRVIACIDPAKEVEGFHPSWIAAMLAQDTAAGAYPMVLPTSLLELLTYCEVAIARDADWVFVVDDGFLETPFTNMVVRTACPSVVPNGCSTTIVTSNSSRLAEHCRRADFLVVVSKQVGFLRREWIKPGGCIIDVYSNLVKEVPAKADPAKLVPVIRGGVPAEEMNGIAGVVAPCPGGLMPVVLAVLMRNCLDAFLRSEARSGQLNRSNAVLA